MLQSGRLFTSFSIADSRQIKLQMLNWANRFNICCFLDNHQYNFSHHSVECMVGAGVIKQLSASAGNALEQLQTLLKEKDWLFGHMNYDLKNEVEKCTSLHSDHIAFPDLFFFIPEVVIELNDQEIKIGTLNGDPGAIFRDILSQPASIPIADHSVNEINSRFSKDEYIGIINQLKKHILRGDCYEINFCQEFYAEHVTIDPLPMYFSLSEISPNPFSAFYKMDDKYLLCASPERYLKRESGTILSQPIKGTWERDLLDSEEDIKNKQRLLESPKDRSENVMVVDLVRNDLAKVCKEGKVKVEELFGVYDFPQVYQMVSTVSGQLKDNITFPEIIRATFPMGSMTGAPKKKVMELIEQYEKTRRGIFSGALGYISPSEDFDFNVVIRSILYNASEQYLSFLTGSGITFYSDPEKEYEECLLKAIAIKKVLAS